MRFFPQKNQEQNNNKTSKREDKGLQRRSIYHNIQEMVIADRSKPGHTACARQNFSLQYLYNINKISDEKKEKDQFGYN